jgi:hypothetical protein
MPSTPTLGWPAQCWLRRVEGFAEVDIPTLGRGSTVASVRIPTLESTLPLRTTCSGTAGRPIRLPRPGPLAAKFRRGTCAVGPANRRDKFRPIGVGIEACTRLRDRFTRRSVSRRKTTRDGETGRPTAKGTHHRGGQPCTTHRVGLVEERCRPRDTACWAPRPGPPLPG